MTRRITLAPWVLSCAACALALPAAAQADTLVRSFRIPSGNLETALRAFAEQSGLQLVYRSDEVRRGTSRGVSGTMTSDAALRTLLRETGFEVTRDASGAMAIVRRPSPPPPARKVVRAEPIQSEAPAEPEQAGDDSDYGEIIVTARKREETLQSVPVAVSVFTGAQLENSLANDLTKLAELAPQVQIGQGGAGTGSVITVRGISSASSDSGLDQSVAIEVDGVPLSRGSIISASLFDVGSIQVLQGPQALFFGKNSPAGVISIQSALPTDRVSGFLTAGYEFEAKERYAEGALSGPITDTLKARVAFRVRKMDGWIRNVATPMPDIINPAVTVPGANWGKLGPQSKDYAGRFTLQWTPDDSFDAVLRVEYKHQRQNAGNANTEPFCINGQTVPVRSGVPIPGADCEKDMRKSHGGVAPIYAANVPFSNGGVPYARNRYLLASLNMSKDFGPLSIDTTTGYFDQKVGQMQVSDWTPWAAIWSATDEHYKLWTQEIRFNSEFEGPVNFMGGFYYEAFTRPFGNASDINHVFNPVAQNYATTVKLARTEGDYLSLFGQARWNILPELELSGGARYSRDNKSIAMTNIATGPAMPNLYPLNKTLRSRYSDSNISPEVTLSWHPQADQTVFAAYKTGYKAGGLSNPLLLNNSATSENIKFKAEKAKGFEIGYKSTLFDRKLRFDIIGYRYNYRDLQVSSFLAETNSFVLQNAASARVQGVQASFDWRVADTLTLRGNLGYNDAKYRRFTDAQCYTGQTVALGCSNRIQNLSGKPLPRAPDLTFSLGAEYRPQLISGWDTVLSAQGSYSGSYMAASDYGPGGFQDSYWLVNASVRVGPTDGPFEVALIGRNLTNSYYMLQSIGWSGTGNANQYVGFFNRPREVVLQGTVRF